MVANIQVQWVKGISDKRIFFEIFKFCCKDIVIILEHFFCKLFDGFDRKALQIFSSQLYELDLFRKKIRKLRAGETKDSEVQSLDPDTAFKAKYFNIMFGRLSTELEERCEKYQVISEKIAIIVRFDKLESDEIFEKSKLTTIQIIGIFIRK